LTVLLLLLIFIYYNSFIHYKVINQSHVPPNIYRMEQNKVDHFVFIPSIIIIMTHAGKLTKHIDMTTLHCIIKTIMDTNL